MGARGASIKTVHPDSKGRIVLGELAKGVSSYRIQVEEGGRLVLDPYVEIPFAELWLHRNPVALERVRRGIDESAEGRTRSLGDFSQFVDDEPNPP